MQDFDKQIVVVFKDFQGIKETFSRSFKHQKQDMPKMLEMRHFLALHEFTCTILNHFLDISFA